MTDPRRLLSDPRGGLESELLRAGAEEEPSARAVERTLVAVGAGVATLGVAGVAASAPVVAGVGAATSLGVAGTVKLLAIGAVAGLASGGALLGVTKVVEQRSARPVPVASPVGTVVPPHEVPPVAPRLSGAREAPPPAASAPLPAPRSASASAPPEGTPLAAEVALVDRAHATLRSGNARGALATLDGYESAFAPPRLLPEVFALRMEASEAVGDENATRSWASRLVSRYPKSAQAARARTLLEGPPAAER